MWSCSIAGCPQPAVRLLGDCFICDRHLCARHNFPPYHVCPSHEDGEEYLKLTRLAEKSEIDLLLAQINLHELLSRAGQLRNGVPCSLTKNPPEYDPNNSSFYSLKGGGCFDFGIEFNDGVTWVARVRRVNVHAPPAALRLSGICSEVATLQVLEKTGVPAPKVIDYSFDSSNPVGVKYILMEKIPGKPLQWAHASAAQKRKVIGQLADVYLELAKYPCGMIGSLHGPSELDVGCFTDVSLTEYTNGRMHGLGPFAFRDECATACILFNINLIMRGEIYTDNPVDAWLIQRFLLDHVKSVFPFNRSNGGQLFLRHANDKGDHILVDDDYNITGIVNWDSAHVDAMSEAFNSPRFMLPVEEFYNGSLALGQDELLMVEALEERNADPDMVDAMRKGRIVHFFEFCSGCDLNVDWEGSVGLFHGLRKALDVDDADLDWESWKTKALGDYIGDIQLQELIARSG